MIIPGRAVQLQEPPAPARRHPRLHRHLPSSWPRQPTLRANQLPELHQVKIFAVKLLTVNFSKLTFSVTSNERKISPKPPVLSPKPNPSEIVKRLSFKRDGLDAPPSSRHLDNNRQVENNSSSKQVNDTAVTGDKKLVDDKSAAVIKSDDRIVSLTSSKPESESRVSSMIAKLSNGTSPGKNEDFNSNIKSERQNFMSKFIKNEVIEPKEDVRDNLNSHADNKPCDKVTKQTENSIKVLDNNIVNVNGTTDSDENLHAAKSSFKTSSEFLR